jgi:hypothetical protein
VGGALERRGAMAEVRRRSPACMPPSENVWTEIGTVHARARTFFLLFMAPHQRCAAPLAHGCPCSRPDGGRVRAGTLELYIGKSQFGRIDNLEGDGDSVDRFCRHWPVFSLSYL